MSVVCRWWVAGALALGLAVSAGAQPLLAVGPGEEKGPTRRPADVSANGLPGGAIARLGRTRLRHPDTPTGVVFAADGKTFLSDGGANAVFAQMKKK